MLGPGLCSSIAAVLFCWRLWKFTNYTPYQNCRLPSPLRIQGFWPEFIDKYCDPDRVQVLPHDDNTLVSTNLFLDSISQLEMATAIRDRITDSTKRDKWTNIVQNWREGQVIILHQPVVVMVGTK